MERSSPPSTTPVILVALTATVAAAGTGQAGGWINGISDLRSDKVIQFTPDVADSGTYQATLYFTTTAEVAVWGAAAPNLNIPESGRQRSAGRNHHGRHRDRPIRGG